MNLCTVDISIYNPEQNLKYYISGNLPQLGSWDTDKAIQLTKDKTKHPDYMYPDFPIFFDRGTLFEYKVFYKDRNNKIIWEPLTSNRTYLVNYLKSQIEVVPEIQEARVKILQKYEQNLVIEDSPFNTPIQKTITIKNLMLPYLEQNEDCSSDEEDKKSPFLEQKMDQMKKDSTSEEEESEDNNHNVKTIPQLESLPHIGEHDVLYKFNDRVSGCLSQ